MKAAGFLPALCLELSARLLTTITATRHGCLMKSSDTTDKSQPWAYFFVSLSFGQTPNLLGRNRWAFSPSSRWEGRQESPGASADGNELAKGKGNQKVLCQDSFWPVESYCRSFGSPNIFFKGLGSNSPPLSFRFPFPLPQNRNFDGDAPASSIQRPSSDPNHAG